MSAGRAARRTLWVLGGATIVLLLVDTAVRAGTRGVDLLGADAWPWPTVTLLLYAIGPLVGAVVASRRPRNPCGWLLVVFGLSVVARSTVTSTATAGLLPTWAPKLADGLGFVLLVGCIVGLFLLFPDGRLPGPRWRWPARTGAAAVPVLVFLAPLTRLDDDPVVRSPWALAGRVGTVLTAVAAVLAGGLLVLALAAMASVLLRYRRAPAVERQQLKWFLAAAAVNAAVFLASFTPVGSLGAAWELLQALGFAVVPMAVGVAVLRYRLYEIDRIISRTVTYGLVTGSLLASYLVLVALLRRVLEPVTGNTELAVAASTLAVAALFRPLRRRVQGVVDRRFDRTRYDAARTVEAYARWLRTEVDLDEVTAGLRRTVAATVAPRDLVLWLPDVPVRRRH